MMSWESSASIKCREKSLLTSLYRVMGDSGEAGEDTLGSEVEFLRHPGKVSCQAVMAA